MSEPAVLQDAPPYDYAATGKHFGIKSGQVRRANAAKLKSFTELLPVILPALKDRLESAQTPEPATCERMIRIQGHLARIDAAMDVCTTASEWRDLSNAWDKLFQAWAHLAGIPKPMAAREVRTTRRVIQALAAPIELPPVG